MQFNQGMLYDESDILKDLPQSIRHQIVQYNSRDLVRMVPLLQKAPASFISMIAEMIKPQVAFQVCAGGNVPSRLPFNGVLVVFSVY
jgi:hypothetical protein